MKITKCEVCGLGVELRTSYSITNERTICADCLLTLMKLLHEKEDVSPEFDEIPKKHFWEILA